MPEDDDAPEGASEPLSIGEVLAVLQEDFPDVTISKIRFLESQGLVRPERNASGYRQFGDGDIERLRWILRQQRDNFLPLKVIKKALDGGMEVADAGMGDQPTLWSAAADAAVAAAAREDASDGDAPTPAATAPGNRASRTDRSPESPTAGSAGPGMSPGAAAPAPDASRVPGSDRPGPEATAPDATASDTPGGTETETEPVVKPVVRRRHTTPADVVAALQEDPRAPRASGAGRRRASDDAAPPQPEAPPVAEGAELDARELLEVSGLTPAELAGLEQYGLVEPRWVGGEATYGPHEVAIARLARRCSELGLEPRHLRAYKVAAEREAGLVEQVVMPLLKQRNPSSKEKAAATAAELAGLGAELHAALLARELGDELAP